MNGLHKAMIKLLLYIQINRSATAEKLLDQFQTIQTEKADASPNLGPLKPHN